jgi:3-methyladenine DNA glycosylase/8-oxoguanine DNA glycosylase
MPIFQYSEKEILYLKKKDKKLGEAMDAIGIINREIMPDLFSGIVSSIISQQISMKAADTIWNRLVMLIKEITPQAIDALKDEQLQKIGISMRKAVFSKKSLRQFSTEVFRFPGCRINPMKK